MKKKAAEKSRAKRIASSLPSGILHRVGVWKCPHCDWQDADHAVAPWERAGILLVTDIVHGKHGEIAYVSECPSCFKKSWIHVGLDHASSKWNEDFPEEWRKKAAEVRDQRHLSAMRTFMASQCARCVHLKEFECRTLPIVKCNLGQPSDYLHTCFSRTDCNSFGPFDAEKEIRDRLTHFYGQTDGTFKLPNSCEGDLLKLVAKHLGLVNPP